MARLTREEILAALRKLAGEIDVEQRCQIALVGGAAMVLLFNARESTKDVDGLVVSGAAKDLWTAVARVASAENLPADWLNDAAKGFVHGLALGPVLFDSPSLTVRALAPEQLLAMKLCAWRDDTDIGDASLLLRNLSGERTDIWARVEPHIVPGRELKAKYAFDDLWEAAHGPA